MPQKTKDDVKVEQPSPRGDSVWINNILTKFFKECETLIWNKTCVLCPTFIKYTCLT